MDRDPNRFATGPEAVAIRARLDEERAVLEVARAADEKAQANVQEMERQVQDMKARLRELEAHRDDAVAYAEGTKQRRNWHVEAVVAQSKFFNPVRRLPLEVLGRIFEYCLPYFDTNSYLDTNIGGSTMRQPFRLAVVCRLWRRASLASPKAWNCLDVSFDDIKSEGLDAWLEMIKCIISRSSSALLDIYVTREKQYKQVDRRHLDAAASISECMSRCRTLRFSVDRIYDSDFIASILTASVPNLMNVWMRTVKLGAVPSILDNRVFPGSKTLTQLNCSPEFIPSFSSIPTVEEFDCEFIEASTLRNHLVAVNAKFPDIKNLGLYEINVPVDVPVSVPIAFARVTKLHVHFQSAPNENLVNILSMPKLRALEVNAVLKSHSLQCASVIQALIRQNAPVHLTFCDLSMDDIEIFMRVVNTVPGLMGLVLRHSNFTRQGLRAFCAGLTQRTEAMEWCNPSLARILLLNCSFDQCDEDVVVSCVRSLAQGSEVREGGKTRTKLKAFKIDGWDAETWPNLEAIIQVIIDEQ